MCSTLAVAIALGAATTVTGIATQNQQWKSEVEAVDRSNAAARTKYINDIQISAYNDQQKLQIYEAQLKADSAAEQNYYLQREINQVEANRAISAADQEFREKLNEQMFNSQANLAKAIEAQGTVLASGQAAGQSMMLSLDQAERFYGFEQAQIDATVFDATKAYGINKYGIDLDKYSADTAAMNNIQRTALMAPAPSFQTIKPIKQNRPEKPSPLGPILSGLTTTLMAGSMIGGKSFWGGKFSSWFPGQAATVAPAGTIKPFAWNVG
tara:strand:- start:187 stop:990 length:804 start_codon:yes stop_codon:yes gene_type:complete